jgi:hypothetical protein
VKTTTSHALLAGNVFTTVSVSDALLVIMGVLERVFFQEYVMVQLEVDLPIQGSDYQEIHRDYRPLFTDQIVTPLYALAVNFSLVEVISFNFKNDTNTLVGARQCPLVST